MQVKCLEIRDEGTFMPVIAIKPIAGNENQRYLLRRDGYTADMTERCVILIKPQCRSVSYDPYDWDPKRGRTMRIAHLHVKKYWDALNDGDVVDVQFILGETKQPKMSERITVPV